MNRKTKKNEKKGNSNGREMIVKTCFRRRGYSAPLRTAQWCKNVNRESNSFGFIYKTKPIHYLKRVPYVNSLTHRIAKLDTQQQNDLLIAFFLFVNYCIFLLVENINLSKINGE